MIKKLVVNNVNIGAKGGASYGKVRVRRHVWRLGKRAGVQKGKEQVRYEGLHNARQTACS